MSSWYDPYWIKLKETNRIELTSDYTEHAHVLKAIRKLAGKDVSFNYLCEEEKKRYRICSARSAHKLIIFLEWKQS